MENSSQKDKNGLSRRGFLPLLGSGLLLPLLGFGKPTTEVHDEDEEYHTLLRKDGTAVRVKKTVVEKSKVVKKNISNKSLLEWLKKDN
jgi:hypothetical protein